ncbi:MAG: nicotinamide mononucleotide transporter [Candidatus Moranbacteria bacterium]|nr:nicotinamide mononucleotide transporter [Candidatus Moranbacteria bacterium]
MTLSLDIIAQVGITVFGVGSVFLLARKNKWGTVLGLLSQPFWFATAIINDQWGIMILNVVYSATWIYGVYNWFFSDKAGAVVKE